jgi:hypothetical protein
MALKDDVIKILRSYLGDEFGDADLPALRKAQFRQFIEPRLAALYKSRIDTSAYEAARVGAEDALAAEATAKAAAEAAANAKAEADVEGV